MKLDPSVRRAAERRVVRFDRMRVAEALRDQTGGRDPVLRQPAPDALGSSLRKGEIALRIAAIVTVAFDAKALDTYGLDGVRDGREDRIARVENHVAVRREEHRTEDPDLVLEDANKPRAPVANGVGARSAGLIRAVIHVIGDRVAVAVRHGTASTPRIGPGASRNRRALIVAVEHTVRARFPHPIATAVKLSKTCVNG